MKQTINILLFTTLAVGGGYMGQKLTNLYSDKPVIATQYQAKLNSNIQTVGLLNNVVESTGFSDLTKASKIGVNTVVHIQTHFVREEITYDPMMKLFYGKDAYKIRERHGQSSGSGVVITDNGYIVTNNHVVQDAKDISVILNDKKYKAKLIGNDPSTDLAVIKIEGLGFKFALFGNSDDLELGEWVVAVGNPFNLQSTVTAGIISAKNRNIDLLSSSYNPENKVFPVESFIQTDAAVNSGNSGGALVNTVGELIGINTAIASGTGFYAGYSFAIPSNIVKKVAYDLINYGEVKRVQLGINLIENNSEVKQSYNLGSEKGVVIASVLEGGNANTAGLKTMDIILMVDSKKINSIAELQESIVLNNPGDKVKLNILRGDIVKTIEVVMVK